MPSQHYYHQPQREQTSRWCEKHGFAYCQRWVCCFSWCWWLLAVYQHIVNTQASYRGDRCWCHRQQRKRLCWLRLRSVTTEIWIGSWLQKNNAWGIIGERRFPARSMECRLPPRYHSWAWGVVWRVCTVWGCWLEDADSILGWEHSACQFPILLLSKKS